MWWSLDLLHGDRLHVGLQLHLLTGSSAEPSDRFEGYVKSVFATDDVRLLRPIDIVRLLLELGQLDDVDIARNRVEMHDRSRRCQCIIVCSGKRGWVVKQGTNIETSRSVRNEIAVYTFLDRTCMGPRRPAMIARHENVLVIEQIAGHTLTEHREETPLDESTMAVSIGEALSQLHNLAAPLDAPIKSSPPILGCVLPPIEAFEYHSNATHEFTQIVQKTKSLKDGLQAVAGQWEPTAFTHNDVRPDNLILAEQDGGLVVIDWEMAGVGDPRWDVASVIVDGLVLFLEHRETWTASASERASGARSQLALLHRTSRAFLGAYLPTAPNRMDAGNLMLWCGARLVQTALERTHSSALLPAGTRHLLQVAANIFARPNEAANTFLGVST